MRDALAFIPSVVSCAHLQFDLGSGFLADGVIHCASQGFEKQKTRIDIAHGLADCLYPLILIIFVPQRVLLPRLGSSLA